MCSLQQNYDVIRNWERFETGPLTVAAQIFKCETVNIFLPISFNMFWVLKRTVSLVA